MPHEPLPIAPRVFSLAHLTVLSLPPAEAVLAAAEAGYQMAGLRLLPAAPGGVAYPLMDDPGALRETRSRLAATGIGVFDLEVIRLDAGFRAEDYRRFMETGQALGARAILVAGDDPDEARLTASFATLCEMAAPFGLTCDLEFMPWTEVPDARAALRVVGGAMQANGRILVDALHAARSATTTADIAALPRQWLGYAQICDAPGEVPQTVEGLIRTARSERLLPGEGRHRPRRAVCRPAARPAGQRRDPLGKPRAGAGAGGMGPAGPGCVPRSA